MHTIVFCPFVRQSSVIGGVAANDVIFGPAVAPTMSSVTLCGKGTPPLSDERTDGQLSASTKEEILKIS